METPDVANPWINPPVTAVICTQYTLLKSYQNSLMKWPTTILTSTQCCPHAADLNCPVTGTFVPTYFRSLELSSPGTFAPESENNAELSLPEWKMACNFHSTPCPKVVVATNCTRVSRDHKTSFLVHDQKCLLSSSEDMVTVDTMGE